METKPESVVEKSPAQILAEATERFHENFLFLGDVERAKIAKRRGLFPDPSVQPSITELRAAVPLEGDTMRYAKGKDGKPRMAVDRHGMPSFPKPHGRRKPHMSKNKMAIKSHTLGFFRVMIAAHAGALEATAKAENKEFLGVPEKDITVIGAKAAKLGALAHKVRSKARREMRRQIQRNSRYINYGMLPGNQIAVAL